MEGHHEKTLDSKIVQAIFLLRSVCQKSIPSNICKWYWSYRDVQTICIVQIDLDLYRSNPLGLLEMPFASSSYAFLPQKRLGQLFCCFKHFVWPVLNLALKANLGLIFGLATHASILNFQKAKSWCKNNFQPPCGKTISDIQNIQKAAQYLCVCGWESKLVLRFSAKPWFAPKGRKYAMCILAEGPYVYSGWRPLT